MQGRSARSQRKVAAQGRCARSQRKVAAQGRCARSLRKVAAQGRCARFQRKVAAQGCSARLQRKVAAQGCSARLQRKVAAQGCSARLQRKVAVQGCSARLVRKVGAQGWCAMSVREVGAQDWCARCDFATCAYKILSRRARWPESRRHIRRDAAGDSSSLCNFERGARKSCTMVHLPHVALAKHVHRAAAAQLQLKRARTRGPADNFTLLQSRGSARQGPDARGTLRSLVQSGPGHRARLPDSQRPAAVAPRPCWHCLRRRAAPCGRNRP